MKDSWRSYVLAELRVARARARLYVAAIEETGKMLKADMISPDTAIQMLWEAQALEFLQFEAEQLPMDQLISPAAAAAAALSNGI